METASPRAEAIPERAVQRPAEAGWRHGGRLPQRSEGYRPDAAVDREARPALETADRERRAAPQHAVQNA